MEKLEHDHVIYIIIMYIALSAATVAILATYTSEPWSHESDCCATASREQSGHMSQLLICGTNWCVFVGVEHVPPNTTLEKSF